MSNYPATVNEIISWVESKKPILHELGITLANIRTREVHVPAVSADFDSVDTLGRISAWVSGEVDFEVLRRANGEDLFQHHESVSTFTSQALEYAYDSFLKHMIDAPTR
jgi:hypothetical protein